MRDTATPPTEPPACWAWCGGAETFEIATEAEWAAVTTGDGRGEFQRQIALVRDRWRRRWLAEWRE